VSRSRPLARALAVAFSLTASVPPLAVALTLAGPVPVPQAPTGEDPAPQPPAPQAPAAESAPKAPDAVPDTPSRLESEPDGWIDVRPGPDLGGWTRQPWPATIPLGPQQWSVDRATGTLLCDGTGGHDWLRLDREVGDAVFHVEWRFVLPPAGTPPSAAPYNSGVLVRTAADQSVWHQAQVGDEKTGFLFARTPVDGTVQRVNLAAHRTVFRVRPLGEWNTYEIAARGRTISLWVNGAVTSEMTVDVLRGHFGVEGEGFRIEFRNLKLKVLDEPTAPAR
jgi:hypothetical protein